MARSMGPRFKVARRLGVNVFNHPKALNRGIKKQKLSEYGEQLLEKQKLKAYYGVLEKQFRRYVFEAMSSKEKSEVVLIQRLEMRLDNIVYRMGFGSTLRQSRQMVTHGHIRVNGQKVDIPSYKLKVGDVLSLKEASKKTDMFVENFNSIFPSVNYIQKDIESLSGTIKNMPNIEDIPVDVKFPKIIEFYSKN
ncbi:30S ribosomal protein S4 [Clostridium sp. YIM B02505]|uniref:Small ribosomal subunit protein uS4 n=1 Tax=Clostridium yunnanense TaxID=2800325 RepID=A0ABS1EJ57_9CLOT|nr:30S ribosomal protein S4 [Clostridium yunnanense]MBK1809386.1 30S ribosomal protein S4 [Clostridium yunnanense]